MRIAVTSSGEGGERALAHHHRLRTPGRQYARGSAKSSTRRSFDLAAAADGHRAAGSRAGRPASGAGARRRRVATATADDERPTGRRRQGDREDRHVKRPTAAGRGRRISAAARGRLARHGPGTSSRVAIASPELKADSTAANAIDCQSTRAARGARSAMTRASQDGRNGSARSRATGEGQRGEVDSPPIMGARSSSSPLDGGIP